MKKYICLSLAMLMVSLFTFSVVRAEGEEETKAASEEVKAGEHKKAESVSDIVQVVGRIAAAIALGLGAFGTAMVQAKVGGAGVGTIAEKPETVGSIIILMALPETIVILGFVIAAMLILM